MKTTLRQSICLSLLFAAIGSRSAEAQGYSIDWRKVSGGGGTSAGGVYSVSGTIGQHDASSAMSAGPYAMTGGFWALYALQTPGAPLLRIFLTTSNTAVVAWPAPSTGFTLQVNTNLATTNWLAAGATVNVVGSENQIVVAPPSGRRFYRLIPP